MQKGGDNHLNVSDVWDWTFLWQMFRNFMFSVSPFVMIVVAVKVVPMLVEGIIRAVRSGSKS